MRQALEVILLFSVWNLLILAAVWRISARLVKQAEEAGRQQGMQATSTEPVTRKPRAKKEVTA